MKRNLKQFGIGLVISLGMALVFLVSIRVEDMLARGTVKPTNENKVPGANRLATAFEPGKPVRFQRCFVAVDQDAWNELNGYCLAGDEMSVRYLVAAKRVCVVEGGTSGAVVQSDMASYRVRITSGKHAGVEGIVAAEFVRAQ